MAVMRYLVNDVGTSTTFYTDLLGFELIERYGPAIAIVRSGNLDVWLAGPISSAARAMPDGRAPQPGGWNRIVIEVEDLERQITRLEEAGATFRNEVVEGPGGRQILLEDPSGNVVELFQRA
jgi:catechol 2,3-dioxygenase-like lactoylglutathione lyase family enzyme